MKKIIIIILLIQSFNLQSQNSKESADSLNNYQILNEFKVLGHPNIKESLNQFEIRIHVWQAFGKTKLFILSQNDNKWKCQLETYFPEFDHSVESGKVVGVRDYELLSLSPRSSWASMERKILKENLELYPSWGYGQIAKENCGLVNDGMQFYVEFKKNAIIHLFEYNNPEIMAEICPIDAFMKFLNFIKFMEREYSINFLKYDYQISEKK